ncbi:flagellar basal body M-ring protein FliF [Mangrovimicrobium sediminis]|uniref:Flagellar M-ring protein n=2 Tax=Mangrovimicrobium sediminis TaxID=2562682 RepID=A0A4Z0M185_9GAMM|nr:flagellar basal body M-ring protein FliF [Haliea sp. SAOS-164]
MQAQATPSAGQVALGNTEQTAVQPLSAERLSALIGPQSVLPLLLVAAAFVAITVVAILWATGPTYQVLYSNLSDADGGAIIAELDRRAVPYEFGAGGQTIMVPSEMVHSLRLQLAEQGLPKGGKVGFELLDNQAFGVSQFAEQVNFQRGLEGELARSVESLGPVSAARVHLAMAKPSVFVQQRVPSKASVVLNLFPGRTLSEGQVNAIIHMISSSVADLAAENVSVVDQRGELLSQPDTALAGLDGTQLKYTQKMEQSYQERVDNILAPLLGENNFRVQVSADVDFSAVEETSEAYAPNPEPGRAAVRSSQSSANFTGDEAVARGIPGALSNTAPNWAPSPIEQTTAEDDAAVAGEQLGNQTSLQRDSVFNFELDRNIRHVRHQMGGLRRLSVAVVVNNRPGVDDEGNPTSEAVPDEELQQITRLVQQAVGYSEQRGDRIEVINSPFTEVQPELIEPTPWWQQTFFINTATAAARYLLAAVLVLFAYRRLVKPVLRKFSSPPAPDRATTMAALSGDPAALAALGLDSAGDGGGSVGFKRVDKSASYQEQLDELRRIGRDDPRMIAMILRGWMKEDA